MNAKICFLAVFLFSFFMFSSGSDYAFAEENQTNQTNITMTPYQNITAYPKLLEFSADIGTTQSLQLNISNENSNRTAYNISIDAIQYITYSQNNFDLEINQTRIINVTFFPTAPVEQKTQVNITSLYFEQIEVIIDNQTFIEDIYVFDENLTEEIEISISGTREQTQISTIVLPDDFIIEYGKSDTGIIRIINNGNITADDVFLELNYTTFSENNFTILPDDDKILTFNITIPLNTTTQDTNKTYEWMLKISGLNFDSETHPVSVFIPFEEVPDSSEGDTQFVYLVNETLLAEYCRQHPDRCPTVIIDRIIFQNRTSTIDLTDEEIQALIDSAADHDDAVQRILNKMVNLEDNTNDFIYESGKTIENLDKTVANWSETTTNLTIMVGKSQKEAENIGDAWAIMAAPILLTGIGGGIGKWRFSKKRGGTY